MILSFIQCAGRATNASFVTKTVYALLARVFAKFPGLWRMNWMFVRRSAARGGRVHRMAALMRSRVRRGASYYESDAFRDDFTRVNYPCPFGRRT